MKTPDESLDQALRDALRRKFDDFEIQPDSELETNIFDHLKNWGKSATARQLLTVALLITFVLTATVTGDSLSKPSEDQIFRRMKPSHGFAPPAPIPNDLESQTITLQSGKKNSDAIGKVRASKVDAAETLSGFTHDYSAKSADEIPTASKNINRTYIHTIAAIHGTSFIERNFLATPEISPFTKGAVNSVNRINRRKNSWHAVANFIPTNTFQALTVNPQPDVTYQNFQLPAPISAQSVGYKLSAGVERNGLQFLLTYGRFGQSVNYEIATDEFLVENTPSNGYQVIRKGVAVKSQNNFETLGMTIRKHAILRSGPFRNYFGDIGLEVNRELKHGQSMVWSSLGVGKELALSEQATLRVGPYLEYSFSKIVLPENQFQIQPYQVGISVGLSYSKK